MKNKNILINSVCIALTIFLSAFLLFLVQPMMGKIILPMLGGSPEVWNLCMMFYQFLLFFGYIYAHFVTKLPMQKQVYAHIGLVLCSLIMLPIGYLPELGSDNYHNPILWMIPSLFISVGIPFFVVSTTSPLLQRWFSFGHRSNPYFLYSLSNLGSFIALFSYPFFIEPAITLSSQTSIWSFAYGVLVVMLILCAVSTKKITTHTKQKQTQEESKPINILLKIKWLLLAFCPSSLMLGVTTYITTDLNPVPLLWIAPLSLYLVTFIIVFGMYNRTVHNIVVQTFILSTIVLLTLFIINYTHKNLMYFHLFVFFIATLMCHGELALSKPTPSKLTEFYLIMSFGGLIGGVFNSLLAPMIFDGLYEYPIILALTITLAPGVFIKNSTPIHAVRDFSIPLILFFIVGFGYMHIDENNLLNKHLFSICIAIGMGIAYSFSKRPVRLGLLLLVMVLTNINLLSTKNGLLNENSVSLLSERNFYGVKNVIGSIYKEGRYNILYHGTTLHGSQKHDDASNPTPLTYYSKSGPMGDLFSATNLYNKDWNIGVIGLGTGAAACHNSGNQKWDFYEIDPAIVALTNEKKLFSFIPKCTPDAKIIIGDARVMMQKADKNKYNLLVIDAFSSDSIPVHLITKEAFNLYFEKSKDNGILFIHISNRYLNLPPVIANIAHKDGYCAIQKSDFESPKKEIMTTSSAWIAVAKDCDTLKPLSKIDGWNKIKKDENVGYWNDDFHNIFEIIKKF